MKKRRVKCLALAATSLFAANAYAVAPGLYLGFMGGPATNSSGNQVAQLQNSAATTIVKPRTNQIGTRAFVGYKINQYAGFEAGFTFFTKIKYEPKNSKTNLCTAATVRIRDIELLGKGTIPIGNSMDVYGKGGVAFVYQTNSGSLKPTGEADVCGRNTYITKARPAVSVGASLDLNQNWVADVSYNKILAGSPANSMSLFALGISYHFVDKYCGQFLCDD